MGAFKMQADKHSPAAGFTLIELMVTILIGAILVSIAAPTYMNQIRKSRRTEARTAVLDLASREERLFSTTHAYSTDPATLGYEAFGVAIGGGYYSLTVKFDNTITTPNFTVTATAINAQTKDIQCALFIVDQTGKQQTKTSGNVDSTAECLK
jgi:type IV pilus assembly protein PilE